MDLYAIGKELASKNFKFIVGNTGSAVVMDKEKYDAYIELSAVAELNAIEVCLGSFTVFSIFFT